MISTRQAAQRLGISERQVQRYVQAGLLDGQPFGDYATAPLMISEASLDRLIALRAEHPEQFRRRTRPTIDTEGA